MEMPRIKNSIVHFPPFEDHTARKLFLELQFFLLSLRTWDKTLVLLHARTMKKVHLARALARFRSQERP